MVLRRHLYLPIFIDSRLHHISPMPYTGHNRPETTITGLLTFSKA